MEESKKRIKDQYERKKRIKKKFNSPQYYDDGDDSSDKRKR